MLRQKKKYSRPKKPFDKVRIEAENVLKEKYGLKNKKEIWKADAAIARIRNLAKQLITKPKEEQDAFIQRLHKKGFDVNSISDVLALDKENWLQRRLQTIVFHKKLTTTTKQARQLIAHKHVRIGSRIVNIPSYQVKLEEEPLVELNIVLKQQETKKSKIEEIKDEVIEEGKMEVKEDKVEEVKKEDKKEKVEVKEKDKESKK